MFNFDQDRRDAIEWAKKTINNPNVVYLDTETTGIGDTDEIIELGIIAPDGTVLFDSLFRPLKPIHPDASRVNGILNEHVLNAPAWTDVYSKIEEILQGKTIIVYNMAFDHRLFKNMNRIYKTGTAPPGLSWECAMLKYSAYRGIIDPRKNDYRWYKLSEAIRDFEKESGTSHRAKDDAETCRRLTYGMGMVMF